MGKTKVDLVEKHRSRLKEIEAEASAALDKLIKECPDNYLGKVRMILALAIGVRRMAEITPGVSEERFVSDAMIGAAIWVELGEPEVTPCP